MRGNQNRWELLLLLLLAGNVATAEQALASSDTAYTKVIRAAVDLLPKRPAQVRVIDVNDARPEDRGHLLKLQAFTIRGGSVVYLTKHGDVLREAVKGSRFHEYMLATVIWHEMAHVAGAEEAEARRQEEALWAQFMLRDVVHREAALAYLAALKQRPPAP